MIAGNPSDSEERANDPLHGLIILDKPTGISSARALYRIRGHTGQRKSGHAGTLDPMASGVLILCLGKATKLVERVMHLPKVYRAVARLDVTSESFDADRPMVAVDIEQIPDEAALTAALASFQGVSQQVPPTISAIKVRGLPAYKRVRRNETVVLGPRRVVIYSAKVLAYRWPVIEFELRCGRGTYVRALIRDLGERLGTGGCMTSLRRCAVGPFDETYIRTIDQIARCADPSDYMISMERTVALLDTAENAASSSNAMNSANVTSPVKV